MAQGWTFYDLMCRNCSKTGLLGVWKDKSGGVEFWNSEWDGFFGFINQKAGPNPDFVRCMTCFSCDVSVERKDEIAISA